MRAVGAWDARHIVLAAIPPLAVAALFSFSPIPQPQTYHLFADTRGCFGVPNFGDVASNLAFLVAGGAGLWLCLTQRPPGALRAWTLLFAGVILVSAGSAYYHWAPSDSRLVWDRLPMTVGFMGAYVALLAEYVDARLERLLLLPAALLGLVSVAAWSVTGDLRLYFAVQALSLGSLPVIVFAFTGRHGGRPWVVAACVAYALAILCEQSDWEVFALTGGAFSGHTSKHVFAAMAPLFVFLMLRRRLAS